MKNRKRNRLQGYDYGLDNLYFVTICVQDRVCCLGSVTNKEMQLNAFGAIAHQQWGWLDNQYPYVQVHVFVVMPNHVHAIVEINRGLVGTGRDPSVAISGRDLSSSSLVTGHDPSINNANTGTGHDLSLQPSTKIKSLSELMGAYKTTSSKQIHLGGLPDFQWQRSFHDHIIRNDQSYQTIFQYIEDNPSKWRDDKFYSN